MSSYLGIRLGLTAATVATAVCGYKLAVFDDKLKKLSKSGLDNRTLVDKLNITYLYLSKQPITVYSLVKTSDGEETVIASKAFSDVELARKLISEHDECLKQFKDAGIWNYFSNTPLVCSCRAMDVSWFVSPRSKQEVGNRDYCVGSHSDISHDDIYLYPRFHAGIIKNFITSDNVAKFLSLYGIDWRDQQDYLKIKQSGIEDKLDHMLANHDQTVETFNLSQLYSLEVLRAIKLYLAQVKALYEMRQANIDSQTLSLTMKINSPVLYWLVKLYYLTASDILKS